MKMTREQELLTRDQNTFNYAHGAYECNECDWTGNAPAMVEHRRTTAHKINRRVVRNAEHSSRKEKRTCL